MIVVFPDHTHSFGALYNQNFLKMLSNVQPNNQNGAVESSCSVELSMENVLFVCFDSLRPINNLSVIKGRSSWVNQY